MTVPSQLELALRHIDFEMQAELARFDTNPITNWTEIIPLIDGHTLITMALSSRFKSVSNIPPLAITLPNNLMASRDQREIYQNVSVYSQGLIDSHEHDFTLIENLYRSILRKIAEEQPNQLELPNILGSQGFADRVLEVRHFVPFEEIDYNHEIKPLVAELKYKHRKLREGQFSSIAATNKEVRELQLQFETILQAETEKWNTITRDSQDYNVLYGVLEAHNNQLHHSGKAKFSYVCEPGILEVAPNRYCRGMCVLRSYTEFEQVPSFSFGRHHAAQDAYTTGVGFTRKSSQNEDYDESVSLIHQAYVFPMLEVRIQMRLQNSTIIPFASPIFDRIGLYCTARDRD